VQEWVSIIQTATWPGAIAALVYAAQRFVAWFEPRANRLIDSHIEFVQSTDKRQDESLELLKRQQQLLEAIHEKVSQK
jgi:hypothetical protein